jgi:protease IV
MYKLADILMHRDILLSRLKKWKLLFFISCFVAIFSFSNFKPGSHNHSEYIAKIEIEGVIDYNPYLIDELKKIEKDQKVKALILFIDSPGGTTYAGEEIFETIKKIRKNKPVVAVLGTVAASGGYMVALASDYIIARNMTITGSIGVLSQNFEMTNLAERIGIKLESFKSSPLKAAPNPFEKTDEAVKQAEMQVINDSFEIFLKMLMSERKMTKEKAMSIANGKIFIGKRAKENNLIDAIGGLEEANLWLEKEKKLSKDMPVVLVHWQRPKSFLEEISRRFTDMVGLNNIPSVKAIAR